MIKLQTRKETIFAKDAVPSQIYKITGNGEYIMIGRLGCGLSIEGNTYGSTVPFVNLQSGVIGMIHPDANLEYVGIITDEGE